MSEFLTALFAVSILIIAWISIRIGERLSKLENRLQWLERTQAKSPGKVIDSQPERAEQQEAEGFPATPP